MANMHSRVDQAAPPSPGGRPHRGLPNGIDPGGGVLTARAFGYLIDLVVIAILAAILWVVIAIVGVITFGLGWTLFAVLPFTGILYSAITVGGWKQSTIGMRMMGLRAIRTTSNTRVDFITAAVHALLFYVAAGTFVLWLLDVAIGMARSDRRLGHDLLVGLAVVRAP